MKGLLREVLLVVLLVVHKGLLVGPLVVLKEPLVVQTAVYLRVMGRAPLPSGDLLPQDHGLSSTG